MRHSGPSRDLAEQYRTVAQAQRRGRWESDKSLVRYGKTHIYMRAFDELPVEIKARGEKILATWGERASTPVH